TASRLANVPGCRERPPWRSEKRNATEGVPYSRSCARLCPAAFRPRIRASAEEVSHETIPVAAAGGAGRLGLAAASGGTRGHVYRRHVRGLRGRDARRQRAEPVRQP